jgi:serine/threonine-protein kinase
MGGQVSGEVASKLACEKMMSTFVESPALCPPSEIIHDGFNAANLAVYDENMNRGFEGGKMGTTLTACLFRNDEVTIGHVGDCRVYLIRQNTITLQTTDHSYANMQLKMGLISAQDAATSELRSTLTRSIGNEPIARVDTAKLKVAVGDIFVLCCDGLWSKVTQGEILSLVSKHPPEEASSQLFRLAEKRLADDNLTIQIVQVTDIERLSNMRGPVRYWKESAPNMVNDLSDGQVLDDRYHIAETIARSGMATIYKATDLDTNRPVALKVPFLQFESDPGFFSRFEREQKIGHALDHPYILKLLDVAGQDKSRPYMVMEYLQGQTLGQLLRAMAPLPVADALRIASRICNALEYLHDHNVVHRDLKPDNVMICTDGSIRIMDFGIAKYDGQRRLTFGGFTPAMGTPDYMAPEQVRGKRGDKRTDIYSLGAMLYEMLTDHAPFIGANPFIIMNSRVTGDPLAPRQFNEAITPQVEEIILHAMARNPADRYPDAAAMRADLDNPDAVEVTGRASRLVEPNPISTSWRKYRVLAVCVGLPLLVVAGFWLSRHVQFK